MPTTILVVDDESQIERLILQRFRRLINQGVYHFLFAYDGLDALDKIAEEPSIDLLLTDINMPRMDGLTLLSRLKKAHPTLRSVVISAYGDMANIRKAMNLGAFDFITKPIDFNDLKVTLEKTRQEIAIIAKAQQATHFEDQNVQLKELHQMKSQFFTNISHELRTPLTVISGIAEQLAEDPKNWEPRRMAMIQRNSNQLLDLVNQILDLRKLEAGKLQLQQIQGDISSFLHYLFEPFYFLGKSQDKELHFVSEESDLLMDYDPAKLLRVVSNLLSNALNYTPAGGHIYLNISKSAEVAGQLLIQIKDTGIGIPEKEIPYVFDRYFRGAEGNDSAYSAKGGTGIGLALSKELVQLMEGKIKVESQVEQGTVFSLYLPIRNEAPLAEGAIELDASSELVLQNTTEKDEALSTPYLPPEAEQLPSLLIVEDNTDIAAYLTHCLEQNYRLVIAKDGQEGIDQALQIIPDIIISDVMMPHKNGFELCQALKEDQRTSHVPIILLTAKTDLESRLTGLRRGADAYLSKPFHREELMVVLAQLVAQRAQLRARYASLEVANSATDESPFSQEDAFIENAKTLIQEHLQDADFSTQSFCKKLGMSYSVLHRKLAALTGRSPSLFIRSIRLQQAKNLLLSSTSTISEIAYDTGFNDPKFFSRVFSKEFGRTPSNFRNSLSESQ